MALNNNCNRFTGKYSVVIQAGSVLPCATLITRSPAVARIADCIGCQWPSRSSKVNDFQDIWKISYLWSIAT